MSKRLLAAVAAAILVAIPGVVTADPPSGSPSSQAGRLDLYVIETTADVAAAMRAEGFDIVSETVDGETIIIEVVMSPGEANKARRAYDLDISLKRNKQGQTTAQAAFEEAENGFEVWRTWSEPGGYRDEMEFLADQYDDLTELITIGQSVQGQDIYAMRVTEKADTKRRGSRPAVLNISAQHAREWISPQVNLRLMKHYLENYGTDARVTDILDTTEIWFLIVYNPDGYDWTFTEGNRLWRKNLADNNGDGQITGIDGVDLNRNFATNWGQDNEGSTDNPTGQTYRGPSPQSEPETQVFDALMAAYDFSFLVNYHSAAELILYGTGNQVDTPTPDDLANIALAGTDDNPAIPGYDPDLSAELYITNGDTTDHAGAVHDIMAYAPSWPHVPPPPPTIPTTSSARPTVRTKVARASSSPTPSRWCSSSSRRTSPTSWPSPNRPPIPPTRSRRSTRPRRTSGSTPSPRAGAPPRRWPSGPAARSSSSV